MKHLVVCLMLIAPPANAHGAFPGGGGFYAGAVHPVVSVDHLMTLLAIGLLLSQRGLRAGLLLLMAGIAAGLALPFAGVTFPAVAMPMLAILIVAGGSIAIAQYLPVAVSLLLSLTGGLCVGLMTDVPLDTPLTAATAGAGVIVAGFLIAAYAMAIGTVLRSRWQGIPLRVVGSWIVAIGLMMMAFLLRDQAVVA
jgi:urease accessory protein